MDILDELNYQTIESKSLQAKPKQYKNQKCFFFFKKNKIKLSLPITPVFMVKSLKICIVFENRQLIIEQHTEMK